MRCSNEMEDINRRRKIRSGGRIWRSNRIGEEPEIIVKKKGLRIKV